MNVLPGPAGFGRVHGEFDGAQVGTVSPLNSSI